MGWTQAWGFSGLGCCPGSRAHCLGGQAGSMLNDRAAWLKVCLIIRKAPDPEPHFSKACLRVHKMFKEEGSQGLPNQPAEKQ